jgi:glycosyltransferase involved in cell wall biosynthesis
VSGPRISVVIPVRNAGAYLAAALDSVLLQTRPADEILVIDDGSDDETPAVIERYRASIRALGCPGLGASAARNLGLEKATGDWVAFLDADDTWLPEKLERQLECLAAHPGCELVFSDAHVLDEGGRRPATYLAGRLPARIDRESLLQDNYICTSSVLARATALRELGGFLDGLRVAQDYDLWLRFVASRPAAWVEQPLVEYRVRPGSISNDMISNLRETLQALETERRTGGGAGWLAFARRVFPLHYTLGHLYLLRGDSDAARAAFYHAVAARPWSPLAWFFLIASLGGRRVAIPLKAAIAVWRLLAGGHEPDGVHGTGSLSPRPLPRRSDGVV